MEKRYPDDYWDGKAGSLESSRILFHNDDYLEFLVTRVWRIVQPSRVIDFGCGYGRFGQMLMPLLPEGSTYTGFDQSADLIEKGRQVFAGSPYQAEFSVGSVHEAPFADDSFDLAVSQAVFTHIPDPLAAIREMIRVTRHGGMVITCDANRNAHNALVYTEELSTQETTPMSLIQTVNREIRRQTGVDHNIGIKTPILMHKAGLKNVQARISDSVRLILPPIETEYNEAVFRAMCEQGLDPRISTDEQRAKLKAFLVKYGISEEDAEKEIERELAWDFREKGREYHTVYPMLLSFSFGTVEKGR
ncbi:MAG TPA: class I SAM-dependent methyltransferase [Armatimonadota bacterium]|nr:class I SAM-dependent methyltransferase [Armatimonadota bacterium]